MFCPKCGSQLPDGSQFCPNCGAQLGNKQQAAPARPAYNQSAGKVYPNSAARAVGASWLDPMRMVAGIGSILTIIFMFLNWLSAPIIKTLSQYASLLGIDTGAESEFNMFTMGDVTDILDQLYKLGSDSSSSGTPFGAIRIVFLILWIVALGLIVFGLVRMFTKQGDTKILFVGLLVAAVVAIVWCMAINAFNGAIESQLEEEIGYTTTVFKVPAGPILTAIAGIGSAVVCKLAK